MQRKAPPASGVLLPAISVRAIARGLAALGIQPPSTPEEGGGAPLTWFVEVLRRASAQGEATPARSALTATQVTTRAYGQGKYALELDNVKCGWISEVDSGHAVGDVVTEKIGGAPLVRCTPTRTYQLQAEGCPAAPTLATDAGAAAIAGALCAALSTAVYLAPAAPIGAIP